MFHPARIPMKATHYGVPAIAAGFLSCASLQAQELIPGTYNPWTASGSAAPTKLTDFLAVAVTNNDPGFGSAGPWSMTAAGMVQTRLEALGLVVTDVGSRALTSVDAGTQSLSFGLDNWADVGSLNLGDLLGAGVAMSWQAELSFAGFQWDSPSYELDFALTAPAGLLSNVADASDTLQVSILDGNGNLVSSLGGSDLVNLLGITLGDPVDNGPLNYVFSGDAAEADGITIRFETSSLVNTSLLGIGSNVATFSGMSLTAVPEPGVPMLAGLAVFALATRRRRGGGSA